MTEKKDKPEQKDDLLEEGAPQDEGMPQDEGAPGDAGTPNEKELPEQMELPSAEEEKVQLDLSDEVTVGEMLLAAREKRKIALEAISQDTKIPVATLQYLETDNFEAIPAKVYATGFLKAYAKALGLDPAQVLSRYEVQTGQTHKSKGDLWEIEEEIVEETLDSPKLLKRFVIPSVLVIAAIVILWSVFGGDDEGVEPPPPLPEAGRTTVREEQPRDEGEAAAGDEQTDRAGNESRDEGRDETGREEPGQAEQQEERPAEQPAARGEMTLRISVEDRIWFDLLVLNMTASGIDTLETDFILEPGESRTFTTNGSFYLRKIGKTEGFSLELDGRPYEIQVEEGRLPRDISITRPR